MDSPNFHLSRPGSSIKIPRNFSLQEKQFHKGSQGLDCLNRDCRGRFCEEAGDTGLIELRLLDQNDIFSKRSSYHMTQILVACSEEKEELISQLFIAMLEALRFLASHLSTMRLFVTEKTPPTPLARTLAMLRSISLATIPSSATFPFFTMM